MMAPSSGKILDLRRSRRPAVIVQQPGRSVECARILLCATLLLLSSTRADAAAPIDWRDAAQCVGHTCALRGHVVAQRDEGAVIRLSFDEARPDVSVLLVRSWSVTWPSYAGHDVVATGKVRRFRDQVELVVREPSAIEVIDAAPSTAVPTPPLPTPTAASASTAAPAPAPAGEAEVERLRQRVHELERRVHELEENR
jgi:hypothetical protein